MLTAEQIQKDVLIAANRRNEEVLTKAFGIKQPRAVGNFKCFRLPYIPIYSTSTPGPEFIISGSANTLERNPAGCTDNCHCQECEWGHIDPWDIGIAEDLRAVHGDAILKPQDNMATRWGGFPECDLHHRMDCPTCA